MQCGYLDFCFFFHNRTRARGIVFLNDVLSQKAIVQGTCSPSDWLPGHRPIRNDLGRVLIPGGGMHGGNKHGQNNVALFARLFLNVI